MSKHTLLRTFFTRSWHLCYSCLSHAGSGALLILIAGACLAVTVSPSDAENLNSASYQIQFSNFNLTSGRKSGTNYAVTDTVGQTGAGPFGQYGSSGYFVGSGFQYIYQIDDFSFTISRVAVDLGTLTPGVLNTAAHNLQITSRGAGGYAVYAYEIHPLRHSNDSTTIPDTTCNSGSCSQTTAGIWTNVNIPGFGFNMSGHDIPADFVNSTYFRQFADQSLGETMQVVMSSANVGTNRTATVTYQAGVSGNQAAGNYQTGIVYVAVPGY